MSLSEAEILEQLTPAISDALGSDDEEVVMDASLKDDLGAECTKPQSARQLGST